MFNLDYSYEGNGVVTSFSLSTDTIVEGQSVLTFTLGVPGYTPLPPASKEETPTEAKGKFEHV
jgi:hypothetical protein